MKKIIFIFLLSLTAFSQTNQGLRYVNSAPSGSCSSNAQPQILRSTGNIYTCGGGMWAITGTVAPTGTVTNVSGTANEVNVVNGTSTPVVSIAAAFDISSHTSTAPIKKGTSLPATCSVGQFFNKTNATANAVLYACTATNTWTAQGGGGGGTGCISSGSATEVLVDDGAGGCTSTGVTIDVSNNFSTSGTVSAASVSTGASPPTVTGDGVVALEESTGQTCAAATVDCIVADSSSHKLLASLNNGSFYALTQTVASGAKALATSAISANTCTSAQTDTATGTATTDAIIFTPNADITGVTGYNVAGTFGLNIFAYPTADTVNFKVCNTTGSSITPGAVTLNWRVTR